MKTYITIYNKENADVLIRFDDNTKIETIVKLEDIAQLYEASLSALRNEASYQKVGFIEYVNKLLESKDK